MLDQEQTGDHMSLLLWGGGEGGVHAEPLTGEARFQTQAAATTP